MERDRFSLGDLLPVLALAPWIGNVVWLAWFLWQR
jgi:hypothetical protein